MLRSIMLYLGSSMFRIVFTPEAIDDLRQFRKYDQQHIIAAIETPLLHQLAHETRHRKRLRPNALAEWELRVQTFRVFYDVDATQRVVKIAAVGHKEGNILFLHGEEYQL
jgi:mRNA-degrading endonuclease RelE of RelBE toxin-antitoxin system